MPRPDFYYESIFEIPFEELYNDNIRGLIFDIDNTLTIYNEDLPPDNTIALLEKLQKMGFKICLLTYNTKGRLLRFNKYLKLDGFSGALKPFTRGIKKAVAKMGTTKQETVIIGDQLFSDILAGKNAGIKTILVKPITEKDFFFVKLKRLLERPFLKKYKINGFV